MRAVLLVPRRADGGHRDRLWRYCAQHWATELAEYPIVEGHHDGGMFNRAAAINQAAREAGDWDVAVILDADVVANPDRVRQAVQHAHATGLLTLPYQWRYLVNPKGTEVILGGHRGSWRGWVEGRANVHVSSCVVVPRPLWDQVGGFDERFEGWGGEDNAFHDACMALAGSVARLPGEVWHLHHPHSPWRDHRAPWYAEAKALADRYEATRHDPDAMRRLLAEPRTPDQVVVVCLTNGRRLPLLQATVQAAEGRLDGPIGRKVVVGHGCRPEPVRAALGRLAATWEVWPLLRRPVGYSHAVRDAAVVAIGSGQPWVFWLEDDFTVEQRIDLAALQAIMVANPQVAQVSLMRQPWYPAEVAAGSVLGALPQHQFHQRDGWVEHTAYWTMNPMLTTRRLLATHTWPNVRGSEAAYGDMVFKDGRTTAAIFGRIEDLPRVAHTGAERAGHGY